MDKKLVVIFFQPSDGKRIVDSDYEQFFLDLKENETFEKNGIKVEHRICTHSRSLIQFIDELLNDIHYQEYYLHFSGHGKAEGIPFDGWEIANTSLGIKLNNPKIKFCFFSSCKSGSLAKEVSANNIPIVIGSGANNLENQFAIKFQRRFYSYLAKKKSFHEAFDLTYVDFRENSNEDLRKQTLEWVHGEVLIRGEGAWDEIENGTKDLNSLQLISLKEEEDRHLIYPSIVEEFKKFKAEIYKEEINFNYDTLKVLFVYAKDEDEFVLNEFRNKFSDATYSQFIKLFIVRHKDLRDLQKGFEIFIHGNIKFLFIVDEENYLSSLFKKVFDPERNRKINVTSAFEEGTTIEFACVINTDFQKLESFQELQDLLSKNKEIDIETDKYIDELLLNDRFYQFTFNSNLTLSDKKNYIIDHFHCNPTHKNLHPTFKNRIGKEEDESIYKNKFIRVFMVKSGFERTLYMIVNYLIKYYDIQLPVFKHTPKYPYPFDFEEELRKFALTSIHQEVADVAMAGNIDLDILRRIFIRGGYIMVFSVQSEQPNNLSTEIEKATRLIKNVGEFREINKDGIPSFIFFITSPDYNFSIPIAKGSFHPNATFKEVPSPDPITIEIFKDWFASLPRNNKSEVELFEGLDEKIIEKYNPDFSQPDACPSFIIEKICLELELPPSKVLDLS